MPNDFKPLLSSPMNPKLMQWPAQASAKLDGIRAIVRGGVVVSRSLKPIPNEHVQFLFGRKEYDGFDGELIAGSPTDPQVYNNTQSAVMSHEGLPDVQFYVFDDCTNPTAPFSDRAATLTERVIDLGGREKGLVLWLPHEVANQEEADALYKEFLDQGYEGIVFRKPDGPYKYGRSTTRECILLKHKPLVDSDAIILGCYEQMANNNEVTKDALGFTTRSSHAEGKTGKDTLGGFHARDIHTGIEFNVGVMQGVTQEMRKEWWGKRDTLVGKTFKYASLVIGVKERPRHPRFVGWRDQIDIS